MKVVIRRSHTHVFMHFLRAMVMASREVGGGDDAGEEQPPHSPRSVAATPT